MKGAFTLVELLVVVTIIVILLALLVPALDKAIYSANLARCGTNLKAIAQGATLYATEFKREYPQRVAPNVSQGWDVVNILARGANTVHQPPYTPHPWDDRPRLFRNIDANAFVDPLAGDIDVEHTPNAEVLLGNYTLVFGMIFTAEGGARMTRSNEKLKYEGHTSTVLAADLDAICPPNYYDQGTIWSSHPDEDGRLQFFASNANPTWSFWRRLGWAEPPRGTCDYNYAYKDGSVQRLNKVKWDDHKEENGHRMIRIPRYKDRANNDTEEYVQLPRE